MIIPDQYWKFVTSAIQQVIKHGEQGLCMRPTPNTVPIKMCVRKAVEGSACCARHQDDCPVKK